MITVKTGDVVRLIGHSNNGALVTVLGYDLERRLFNYELDADFWTHSMDYVEEPVPPPIQIDHVKPSERVAWLADAREDAHVQRLTQDNARLAESMAKLEDAIGLMRETVAEQNKIIAEQARELYRFRCAR